jgi:hypothetical protein
MPRYFRIALEWLIPLLVAAIGFWVVIATFWPGFMSHDSVVQLGQARSLQLTDSHPPIMALLWHVSDRIIAGPAGMLLFMNVLYWAGLVLFFRFLCAPLWFRAASFSFVAIYPAVFCIQGIIWKDVLMQSALAAMLGLALVYHRTRHWAALVGGIVLYVLALGARHNAAAAGWSLLALFAAAHPLLGKRSLALRILLAAAAAFIMTLLIHQATALSSARLAKQTNYWQTMLIFDLAGMSVQTNTNLFSQDTGSIRGDVTMKELKAAYNPREHLDLYKRCVRKRGGKCEVALRRTHDPVELRALKRNWRDAVWNHPGAYFQHRSVVYQHLIGMGVGIKSPVTGIKGNDLGIQLAPSPFRERILKLVRGYYETPFFSVWVHLAVLSFLAGVAFMLLLQKGETLPFSLASSGLLYNASFFIFTGAPDFRYSVWTILMTLLTAIALLGQALRWKRAIRRG